MLLNINIPAGVERWTRWLQLFPSVIPDILISDLQYLVASITAFVIYDYFLTLPDEVCQSYRPSGVQISNTGRRYLTSGDGRRVGVSIPDTRSHAPLFTLPSKVSYLFIAVRLLAIRVVSITMLNRSTTEPLFFTFLCDVLSIWSVFIPPNIVWSS